MQTFPEPGMEPESPAVETLSLNHWATGKTHEWYKKKEKGRTELSTLCKVKKPPKDPAQLKLCPL